MYNTKYISFLKLFRLVTVIFVLANSTTTTNIMILMNVAYCRGIIIIIQIKRTLFQNESTYPEFIVVRGTKIKTSSLYKRIANITNSELVFIPKNLWILAIMVMSRERTMIVEMPGVEPGSKRGSNTLSTCLALT